MIDGKPYMVNNAGAARRGALDADVADHVRIVFHEGNRWVLQLSWIGSDGETLSYRPGAPADPHSGPGPQH